MTYHFETNFDPICQCLQIKSKKYSKQERKKYITLNGTKNMKTLATFLAQLFSSTQLHEIELRSLTEKEWKYKQMFSAVIPKTCLFLSSWVLERPCSWVSYCAARVFFELLVLRYLIFVFWQEVKCLDSKTVFFAKLILGRQILGFFVSFAAFSKVSKAFSHFLFHVYRWFHEYFAKKFCQMCFFSW